MGREIFQGSGGGSSSGGDPSDPSQSTGDPGSEGNFGGNNDGVVPSGTAPTTYDYDIVSEASGIGSSYICSDSSSMQNTASVAVYSRLCAFTCQKTSSSDLNSCVSYVGNFGFCAYRTSSMQLQSCISSIHKYNYTASSSSSLNTQYCCSVFPVDYGIYITGTSTYQGVEFESMTVFWASGDPAFSTTPVHFGSWGNSNMNNSSTALSSRTAPSPSGLSGGLISLNSIRFMWSEKSSSIPADAANATTIGNANVLASYRYVPLQHSVDYGNVIGTDTVARSTNFSNDLPALFAVIAYRDNYVSVKPPANFSRPEDNTGASTTTGLTGGYSLSALLVSGA
jgi:hypothetical protein